MFYSFFNMFLLSIKMAVNFFVIMKVKAWGHTIIRLCVCVCVCVCGMLNR